MSSTLPSNETCKDQAFTSTSKSRYLYESAATETWHHQQDACRGQGQSDASCPKHAFLVLAEAKRTRSAATVVRQRTKRLSKCATATKRQQSLARRESETTRGRRGQASTWIDYCLPCFRFEVCGRGWYGRYNHTTLFRRQHPAPAQPKQRSMWCSPFRWRPTIHIVQYCGAGPVTTPSPYVA